jgi:hypothetical protein
MHSSQKLYAVEPDGQRFIEWLSGFLRSAIRVYWDITVSLPVAIVSIGLALLGSAVCVMDLFQKSRHTPCDLITLAISIPFLAFHRFRVFFWTWFACQVVWLMLLLNAIMAFTGRDFDAKTTLLKTLLAIVFFAPPLLFTFYIGRLARTRRTAE